VHRDVHHGPLEVLGLRHLRIADVELDHRADFAIEVDIGRQESGAVELETRVIADRCLLPRLADDFRQDVVEGSPVLGGVQQGVGALVGGADQCVLGQQIGGGHEVRALGDEVGLAAQRDEHAGLPPVGHPGDDQAVRGLSLGSLGQRGQPLLTENLHRPIDVAGRFLQGFLAIHHALAGSVAKFHDGRS